MAIRQGEGKEKVGEWQEGRERRGDVDCDYAKVLPNCLARLTASCRKEALTAAAAVVFRTSRKPTKHNAC